MLQIFNIIKKFFEQSIHFVELEFGVCLVLELAVEWNPVQMLIDEKIIQHIIISHHRSSRKVTDIFRRNLLKRVYALDSDTLAASDVDAMQQET